MKQPNDNAVDILGMQEDEKRQAKMIAKCMKEITITASVFFVVCSFPASSVDLTGFTRRADVD